MGAEQPRAAVGQNACNWEGLSGPSGCRVGKRAAIGWSWVPLAEVPSVHNRSALASNACFLDTWQLWFFSDLGSLSSRRAPTATFHDSKHNIVHVHFDATRGWLLTSGTDKIIKVGGRRLL